MPKTVRWGVFGCGARAARRAIRELRRISSNAEIVSVMDISEARATEIAERFDIRHHCVTEEALLEHSIDAVYIASPQKAHCRQTVIAASAGKHVLCALPIAVRAQEVDEMAAACDKAGVKFMAGFWMRNNAYNRRARQLVQAGTLGHVVMGRAQWARWFPPKSGAWRQDFSESHGGALVDMGIHCLDLLEWITGSSVVEVTGFQNLMTHGYLTRIEDASTIVVRFASGAHGIVDNYFNLPTDAAQNALEINGTKGVVIAAGTVGPEPTGKMFSLIHEEEAHSEGADPDGASIKKDRYTLKSKGLYGQMIADFTDCIIKDQAPPASLEDGRHSVALVDAIYRAARERRVVQVAGP